MSSKKFDLKCREIYPAKDNSCYITVRLDEVQYAHLKKLQDKTGILCQSTIFRHLINGITFRLNLPRMGIDPYREINYVRNNVRQLQHRQLPITYASYICKLEFLTKRLEKFSEFVDRS